MDIRTLVQESAELLREVKLEIQNLPGQMNLLDLASTTHLENNNSDILAFLINPNASHHHPEFGEKFLSVIKPKCNSIVLNKINMITRERPTDKNRRIDLFLGTESDIIIIENKVYATDLDNQLNHYIEWASSNYKKNVFALYLTLDGSNPLSYSLPTERREELTKKGMYANLTYKDDILPWLESFEVDNEKEVELYSAIVQYIDSIKGLCGLKEEDIMKEKSFTKMLLNEYGNLNREDLTEVLDSIELLRDQIPFIAIVNFIRELHSKLSSANTTFYTHHQKRFSNEEEWIAEILKDKTYIGLEVALEQSGSTKFGLGIEFSSMYIKDDVAYGIMSHDILGTQANTHYFNGKILSNWVKEKYAVEQKDSWFEVTYFKKWINSAICRIDFAANWEQENNIRIVDHIYSNWFISDLENYKSLSSN